MASWGSPAIGVSDSNRSILRALHGLRGRILWL